MQKAGCVFMLKYRTWLSHYLRRIWSHHVVRQPLIGRARRCAALWRGELHALTAASPQVHGIRPALQSVACVEPTGVRPIERPKRTDKASANRVLCAGTRSGRKSAPGVQPHARSKPQQHQSQCPPDSAAALSIAFFRRSSGSNGASSVARK